MTATPPAPDPAPLFVRPSKLQAMFGISKSTAYLWVRQGHLTVHRRGAASFFEVAEVRRVVTGQDAAK